jgi:hypothetical protein
MHTAQYTLAALLNEKRLRWWFAVIAGLLLAVAGEGPDFGHYTDWAAAALSGDVFVLRGSVLSPGGVPFTIAAAGPGLVFAVAKLLLVPLTIGTAALLTGWIAAVIFWGSAFVVFRRVAAGDQWLALFGAVALFTGTHAGLYSHVVATEVFADALIAALWALALTRLRWRLIDSVAVGALAGLLLLVRAHVVLYAIPALWLAVFGDERRSLRAVVTRTVAVATPCALALGEYLIVNRWMTGSAWHPPYVYGGAGFSSVDLRHPQIAAVLVHPWHGLLSYHPLYAVAFLAVVLLAWHGRELRPLWIVTVLAAVAHVWVQGGWYIWWLGGATFGMRGMAPAALPLVAGLVALIRLNMETAAWRARAWLIVTVLSCAWSYPLLLRGYTGFYSWSALMAAQVPALAAMSAALATGLIVYGSRRAARGVDFELRGAAVTGTAAVVAYLLWQLSMFPMPGQRVTLAAIGAGVVLLGSSASTRAGRESSDVATVTLSVLIAVFAVQLGLFVRLAIRTEQRLASGAPPPRDFEFRGASPVEELRVTYKEYLAVPGFQDRKRAFRKFLEWQRLAVSSMSPRERDMGEAMRLLLDGDPIFDEVLAEVSVRDGNVQITGSGMNNAQQSRARQLALAIPGVQSVTFSSD